MCLCLIIHRPREIGRAWQWGELEKMAHFKNLCFSKGPSFSGANWKSKLSRVFRDLWIIPLMAEDWIVLFSEHNFYLWVSYLLHMVTKFNRQRHLTKHAHGRVYTVVFLVAVRFHKYAKMASVNGPLGRVAKCKKWSGLFDHLTILKLTELLKYLSFIFRKQIRTRSVFYLFRERGTWLWNAEFQHRWIDQNKMEPSLLHRGKIWKVC